jgi:NADH-quinone oxidoreductase subunit F
MEPAFDLTLLDSVLAEYALQGRTALLPALSAAQNIYGYLPEPVVARVAQALRVPLADVHGVISFYAMLYSEPVGQTIIRVCTDPPCAMRGGDDLLRVMCQRAGVNEPGATSADGAYTVERAPCLGLCADPVAVNVSRRGQEDVSCARVDVETLDAIFDGGGFTSPNFVGGDVRILTALCGGTRAATLKEYEHAGGFTALRRALSEWTPRQLIEEVKAAGLVGRGGAAFPTGAKWEACANAPGAPKYVVVNADESEPGTFKDRILLENDPNRILEGAMLAAYAIGAHKAYVYIRGEYPLALQRVKSAIEQLKSVGYLGKNILGSGFDLEIEVRSGAGAYVCGEETALFESIEGKRGFPRVKPPFPVTYGLFGQPTVINNVETLASVPTIVSHGAANFRQLGTDKSPGSKLFCVSGDVARPGLYEAPFGTTIRHLLELAGGVNGELQAILFGGAAGAFASEKDLDVKLSFEDLRAAGLPLGSGVVMVFNHHRDLRDALVRLARFFAHESCGKCYPCQLGTQRQLEILQRVAVGKPEPGDIERLSDVGWTMADASLCGLGQTAASAVRSAMKLWPELFN